MRVAKNPKRPGWKANALYLTDKDAKVLEAICKLEGETMAGLMRHALREYGSKLAKRHGTTWAELARGVEV